MPKVPVYQRTETLRPAFQQGITTQASADDFGAAIGRGLSAIGEGVSNAGDALAEYRAIENETTAKDRHNQYLDDRRALMYDPETGYMNSQGKTALDQRAEYEKRLKELRYKYSDGLSPGASQLFNRAVDASEREGLQSGIIHAGAERKSYISNVSKSRIDTFTEEALAQYQNPQAVEKYIIAGEAELQRRAQLEGWGADMLENQTAEYRSGVHKNVALALANDDPVAAQEYVNEHKDVLTGPHRYDLETTLSDAVKQEQSKREADRILTSVASSGEASPAIEGVAGPRLVGGGEMTLAALRRFEGFRSTPYWDVNAYRTGYGSDTITRADGTVVPVTENVFVTRADAERDLARRAQEFQAGIRSDIGDQVWYDLPPAAQAALTSIAYNYGSLPSNVEAAAQTGDEQAIAEAIRARSGDNGGINKGRRMREAAMITGGGGASMSPAQNFTAMEAEIAKIEDPEVRELTRKRLYAALDAQEKANEYRERAAKQELWNAIDSGLTPDEVSVETRRTAGMSAVSAAWEYHEKTMARGEPKTDERVLYDLHRIAATDPERFANVDLFDYRSDLDKKDFADLQDKQNSALTNTREAVQTGKVYSDAYSQADAALEAIGLTTVGREGEDRRKTSERVAQFNNALRAQIDEYRAKNEALPSYAEIDQMISRLLLPVVFETPGAIFGSTWPSSREGFAFEARYRPDGTTVDIRVEYQDIPVELREAIKRDISLETGRKPSNEEVVERYEAFVLTQ